MDLFKFNYDTIPTLLENGEAINGYDSVMWVERYLDPGEFEIKAKVSSGLKDFLPIGTFISHADTLDVMIVENHQITEGKEDPEITITGRSFESFLENRIVGVELARTNSTIAEYVLTSDSTWWQAVQLLNDHIVNAANVNDRLDYVEIQSAVTDSGPIQEDRTIDRTDLLSALIDVLSIEDLGIRTIRPHDLETYGDPVNIMLLIHRGTDRSASVHFSWKGGDLDSAEYLFSDRKRKTSALVLGRYVYRMVDDTNYNKYDRRIGIVAADDLDGHLPAAPTGGDLTTLLNKMAVRGRQVLARQRLITITSAQISQMTNHKYRKDYELGDIVSIYGNFGQRVSMRVVEYAEIEDSTGESGHPSLSIPGVV